MKLNHEINPFIIALQETWLRCYKNVQLADHLREFVWIFKNVDNQVHQEDQITSRNMSYHGTALGISKKLAESMREIPIQSKNCAVAELKMGVRKLLVASIYMPTMGKDVEFDETIDSIASMLDDYASDSTDILLMGDWNIDVGSSRRRIASWMNFLADYSLTDNCTGKPTHIHKATKTESELDRVLTRGIAVTTEIVEEDLNKSSHKPLKIEMTVEKAEEGIQVKGEEI